MIDTIEDNNTHVQPFVPVVTIDGGAATGKGAVSSQVAVALGFHYLDSGVYYRALGVVAMQKKINIADEEALEKLAYSLRLSFHDNQVWLEPFEVIHTPNHTLFNITHAIRTEEASVVSSKVSRSMGVRKALLTSQRASCKLPGLVAEGRDMGTVVFPLAPCKIFLQCELDIRAQRRVLQLENQGVYVNIAAVREGLALRDEQDKARAHSPLKPAIDAVVVDTSHFTLPEVVAHCVDIAKRKLASLNDLKD